MKNTYAEIEYQCAAMIDYLCGMYEEETTETLGCLHEQLLSAITAQMELRYKKAKQPVSYLSAHTVTIEVKDEIHKRIYRRTLPLDYEENDNGILLSGEDAEGNPASISFLSDSAAEKIMALTGKGWNNPRCNHENEG